MNRSEFIYGELLINDLKNNDNLLWKYFDLHRFIYMLNEKKLFFTRLDKLEDPFEGVHLEILKNDAKYFNIPLEIKSFDEDIPYSKKQQLINEKKLHDYLRNQEIEKSQNKQYVNCWFKSERESMAMWNLYSNPDSVALKVKFEKLKEELTKQSDIFILENGKRLSVIGEQITYLKLNPFDEELEKQNLKFSAMQKDISFEYEKEYRFLIVTTDLDEQPIFFEIPIDIEKLEITVISHPNMENWKFENIQKLILSSKLNIKFKKSSTILHQ